VQRTYKLQATAKLLVTARAAVTLAAVVALGMSTIACSRGSSSGSSGGPFSSQTGGPFQQPGTAPTLPSGAGTITAGPALNLARADFTATLLVNNRILVVGGAQDSISGSTATIHSSSELFDPAIGAWDRLEDLHPNAPTNAFMMVGANATSRMRHTATLLNDGRVLIAGGLGVEEFAGANANQTRAMATCFTFDQFTQIYSAVGSMSVARQSHQAATLSNNNVLVAGGIDNTAVGSLGLSGSPLTSAEVFSPASNGWAVASSMASPHNLGAMVNALDQILFVGGGSVSAGTPGFSFFLGTTSTPRTEIYSASSNVWFAGAPNFSDRFDIGVEVLAGSSILFVGGRNAITQGGALAAVRTAEIYDPATATWQQVTALSTARSAPELEELGTTGDTLILGGRDDSGNPLSSVEVYSVNTFSSIGTLTMSTARVGHETIELSDNRVFIMGGFGSNGAPTTSVDIHSR
jgi:hypothetical protein